jgi:CxxC-x17-CxxC domain-containing protein
MMKRKPKKNDDIVAIMAKVQEQLAVLDKKLDSFMTKSLTELAQAMAASKPAPVLRPVPVQNQTNNARPIDRPGRPMFAVVCFECGADCEIPFKPSSNRPVYCKICFAKRKAGSAPTQSAPTTQNVSLSGPNRLKSTIVLKPAAKAPKKAAAKKTAAKTKAAPKRKTAVKKVAKRKKSGK